MIKIDHMRQENDGYNWKCGIVCLAMVFKHYHIQCNQDEMWEILKQKRQTGINQYYTLTYLLAQYAISKGLNATIYKTDRENCLSILDQLDENLLLAILSVKEKKSGQSHFIVYCGKKDGKYCFSDPNKEKEIVKYDYDEVREIWKENPAINVSGYVYIVFDNNCNTFSYTCTYCHKDYPVLMIKDEKISPVTICPYCDRGKMR